MGAPLVRLDGFQSPEDYAANVHTLCTWLLTRGYAIVQLPIPSSQVGGVGTLTQQQPQT